MSDILTGGCLCGAVRYSCNSAPIVSVRCQCADCRRNSGTGHSSKFAVPAMTLTLSGELKFYETSSETGNVVRRGFCPNCGSPIIAESNGNPDLVAIAAGSLDQPKRFQPNIVLYASSAVPWDYIDPQLPKFDKMPQKPDAI
jgi:hypothetical protein